MKGMVHSSTDRNTKLKKNKIGAFVGTAGIRRRQRPVGKFFCCFFLTLVLFTCRRDQRNKRVASLGPGPKTRDKQTKKKENLK